MAGEGLFQELKRDLGDDRGLSAKVVAVLGCGVSVAASGGAPTASWRGLLESGLDYCVGLELATSRWRKRHQDALDDDDATAADWIGVASAIEDKLGAPKGGDFGNWLREAIGSLEVKDRALIDAVSALNIPIFTLNYDRLVEQTTKFRELTWQQATDCERLLRGEGERKIVHMHGHYEHPESVVLGLASYAKHAHARQFAALQQAMRVTKSLLFIGCGGTLADPNWGALLEWSRDIFGKEESHRHYWLVCDDEITQEKRDKYRDYRIELIGYGPKHADLTAFLKRLAPAPASLGSAPAKRVVTPRPPTATQIVHYCELLERNHEHAPGLFREHVTQLDTVYVELQLDRATKHSRADESHTAMKAGAAGTTLEDLLRGDPTKRWVVLGDPGAGKSTLARHLVWQVARTRQQDPLAGPLPVFAALPALIALGKHTFNAAEAELCARYGDAVGGGFAEHLFARARREHGVWLFLDGLDEVTAAQSVIARQRLETYAHDLPNVTIVVFSRPIGFKPEELKPAFESVARIVKLDDAKQLDLLASWLDGVCDASEVLKHLQARLSLREACRTPLLLSLLAFLVREQHKQGETIDLPSSRARLFGKSLETLLKRGQSYAGIDGVDDWSGATVVLRHLAARLQAEPGEAWTAGELENVLLQLRSDIDEVRLRFGEHGSWRHPRAFLDEVASKSGVLGPHDGDEAAWRFLHRQFKELLVAEVLRKDGDAAVIDKAKALDPSGVPRWAEALGFACELAEDPLLVLRQLGEVSTDLALRVLPEVEGVDHVAALTLLLEQQGDETDKKTWDGDYLVGLVRRWAADGELERDQVVAWLWQQVTPGRTTEHLAYFHYALECLEVSGDKPLDRETFFRNCGRWPKGGPVREDWKRMPPEDMADAGGFEMGSLDGEKGGLDSERPQHRVELEAFEMSATAVTNEEYEQFDPDHERESFGDLSRDALARHPVVNVSWWEAYLYCRWLGGHLPTEAQWEYACRAGTTTRFWKGDADADLAAVGWYDENAEGRTHEVGEKAANAWGLFDMHGNVWEWSEDWWSSNHSEGHHGERGTRTGIRGLSDGQSAESRVFRGGGWVYPAGSCRSACRSDWHPGLRGGSLGLRAARVITCDFTTSQPADGEAGPASEGEAVGTIVSKSQPD